MDKLNKREDDTETKRLDKPPEEPIAEPEKVAFTCVGCGMSELCDYFGSAPHFTAPIVFRENVFIMHDPFTNSMGMGRSPMAYLVLGGECRICGVAVCADQNTCSIFYGNRFCLKCALGNLHSFPDTVQKDIIRMAAEKPSTS